MQITLRQAVARHKRKRYADIWPIAENAVKPPEGWTGWPEGKRFALVLTHDVDTQKGHDKCLKLADMEESFGLRSSFNFVIDDYRVSHDLLKELARRGFEIGIHGLNHDYSLYHSRREFLCQAIRINQTLKEWSAVGFRSPCMFHNLDWMHDLDIEYDASTFDTDPFEPQPDGLHTIFPVFIPGNSSSKGYVELPYTLPQDFTLFILLGEKSINIWKRKLDWLVEKGGLALINTHPDYMAIGGKKSDVEEYNADHYREFLEYNTTKYHDMYLNVLPREIARFWTATQA